MKIYPKARVNIIGGMLIVLMLCASHWQWRRHHQKLEYIATLEKRLAEPVVSIVEILKSEIKSVEDLIHRKVRVEGTFDFNKEVTIRNRRYEKIPGHHVITPLKIDNFNEHILVNRGFVPLTQSTTEARKAFQKSEKFSFIGLVKKSKYQKLFAPKDSPAGPNQKWVNSWLRVNIPEMQKQIPYKLLPFYLEIMETTDTDEIKSKIISSQAGKEDMFLLPMRSEHLEKPNELLGKELPIPVFDTVIPAGRHYGYIFEWASMALMTAVICLILQLKPSRQKSLKGS